MSLAFPFPDEMSLQQDAPLAVQGSELKKLPDDRQAILRSSAEKALKQARAVVTEAEQKGALWIPARNAHSRAEAAFAVNDYQETIVQARRALHLATLGIKQLDAPPYRHF